jgi:hypothetical protein
MKRNIVQLFLIASTFSILLFSCEDDATTPSKPVSAPVLRYDSLGAVRSGSVTFFGAVTSGGNLSVGGRGVLYSDTVDVPTFAHTLKAATGEGIGAFSTVLTGLKPRTNYKARIFARNAMDTTYSDVIAFFSAPLAAKVSAGIMVAVGRDTIEVKSSLTDTSSESIYDRGFVYGTASSPNILTGTKLVVGGSSLGDFSGILRNLLPDKQYYIRPFVRNRGGVGYGTQVIVRTLP